MNRRRLTLAVLWVLVPVVASAIGPEVRRVTPPTRPYIVEIGDPLPIGQRGLQDERKVNTDLNLYLQQYGWPDYAERQEIAPDYPWYPYEVRLYYLDVDREIAFGRAHIAPTVKNLGAVKYLGRMEPATRDRIVALVTPAVMEEPEPVEFRRPQPPVEPVAAAEVAPVDEIELLVRRVEAAADRAATAADRAAVASDTASRAADRTVSILDKLAQ
jgi:hypothetical protein